MSKEIPQSQPDLPRPGDGQGFQAPSPVRPSELHPFQGGMPPIPPVGDPPTCTPNRPEFHQPRSELPPPEPPLPHPAHGLGYSPTAEEVARLEELELRRRAQNRERQRCWRQRHPDKHSENKRKWRERHAAQIAQHRAAYDKKYNSKPEVKERKARQARERYARKSAASAHSSLEKVSPGA